MASESSSANLAKPKSATFARSFSVMRTLEALTSLWMIGGSGSKDAAGNRYPSRSKQTQK